MSAACFVKRPSAAASVCCVRRLCTAVHQDRRADAEGTSTARFAPKNKSRKRSVYGWGLAAGGALAVPEFIDPKHFERQLKQVHKPCRVPFADNLDISFVAAGFGFSLFASNQQNKSKPKVYGAGLNVCGQLGFHATKKDATKSMQWLIYPKAVAVPLVNPASRVIDVACGRTHSLVATSEGLFAFGNNSLGQCGRPIIELEDYANNATVHKVDLPSDSPIVQVACGLDTSFALLADGTVYSFGLGADGQLGNGACRTEHRPQLVGGDLQGVRIARIAISTDTALAVSADGGLFGWGQSEYQQLSVVSNEPQVSVPRQLPFKLPGRVVNAAAGGSTCAVLTDGGEVYVWGYGILGQGPEAGFVNRPSLLPSPLFDDVPVRTIEAGGMHLAAINERGDLFMWGRNRFGLLGLGHEKDQYFPFKVCMAASVGRVALGPDHTMAVTS
uniref:Uncharacterized protein n=1 Tax=Plectus sambesii TaxID=2011161 RepID=A0A914X4T4_9BILA